MSLLFSKSFQAKYAIESCTDYLDFYMMSHKPIQVSLLINPFLRFSFNWGSQYY